ncbi:HTH_48 domain-containing protein [Nephila pilipes]|uniref:HTH_48 domain-containing protein n=1 Tax=Nephila pilipes TaxID=299642 RepID=A0A8X6MH79_NEPPI|nr:HTH_48 domain-containing protein [Nephila pilipes]
MSIGSVFTIMTEDLKKKKLCARFVPHTLTTEQKEHRIASSEDLIAAADEDPNFLKTIVTGDESWCLEYDPQTKRQSSEWTSPGKGRPMKVQSSTDLGGYCRVKKEEKNYGFGHIKLEDLVLLSLFVWCICPVSSFADHNSAL